MQTWQQHVLSLITPTTQLCVVFDPHGLVRDPSVCIALESAGYLVVMYTDDLSFRLAYESTYRPLLRQQKALYVLVVVPDGRGVVGTLPYVLLHQRATLEVSLERVFPRLHAGTLRQLSSTLYQRLWERARLLSDPLSPTATQQFVLREVYDIDTTRLQRFDDAIALLCRIHESQTLLPENVYHVITATPAFQGTHADTLATALIPPSRFFALLQHAWQDAAHAVLPDLIPPGLAKLPIAVTHEAVRPYVVSFFQQHLLEPVSITTTIDPNWPAWVRAGLREHANAPFDSEHIDQLRALVASTVPAADASHTAWIHYADVHARYAAACVAARQAVDNALLLDVDSRFRAWLETRYKFLHSISSTNPAMVHHVTRHMVGVYEQNPQTPVALLVIDGLGLQQWHLIERMLAKQVPEMIITNAPVFAWIPTLTNVSRQAIFAGKPPAQFSKTITSTHAEKALWQALWQTASPPPRPAAVAYGRGYGLGDAEQDVEGLLNNGTTRVIGMVIDTIDELVHTDILGAFDFTARIQLWMQQGYLATVIGSLLAAGYTIWLTADHGNVECIGTGKLNEGVLADQRGSRVRIYPNETLRTHAIQEYGSQCSSWHGVQLPPDFRPVLIDGFGAFATQNTRQMSHGGASIAEVIVPFARIRKEEKQ